MQPRSEIGTLVTCAAFRNPAILAKMAVTVDEISGGRLIFGLGAGWNKPEFDAFGLPFDHRVDRFEEALQIIVPLLREGHVNYQGVYHIARDCTMNPRGPRAGGPPLLIGARGPRMIKLTARFADLWNTDFVTSPSELIEPRTSLVAECAAIGRDPASLQISATVHVTYPEIAPAPLGLDSFMSGTAEEVALVLKSFADSGVSHLMCHCEPNTDAALSRLADAIHLYRRCVRGSTSRV
jgi:alkanesulfonate monooxygenase SsuD/methylene tetrahydromethanopterin reductase-like flavin-dependent oxidoreductase (luciferase family)